MKRLVVMMVLGSAACSSAEPDDLMPPDAGIVTTAADSGVVTTTDDAGVVAVEDAGVVDAAPVRTLVQHRILGDSPIENLVMNPNLTSLASVGPFGNSRATQPVTFALTPTKQPALQVAPRDMAFLYAQSKPGLFAASVWIGRRGEALVDSVIILGTSTSEIEGVAELTATGETMELEGIIWERREASFISEYIGNLALLFTNDAGAPMFVTGPVITVEGEPSIVGKLEPKRPVLSARTKAGARRLLQQAHERAMNDFRAVELPERLKPGRIRAVRR